MNIAGLRPINIPLAIRVFRNLAVGPPAACWEWTACRTSKGYGQFTVNGRSQRAHRIAYELAVGPIPDGSVVMHKCDNPPCCNPAHLTVGTIADNNADAAAKGRKRLPAVHFCRKGHEFTSANTYVDPKRGHRQCRTCRADRQQASRTPN